MRLPWKLSLCTFFLSIKFIFAYYQMCFCLLSNVNMIAVKFVIVDSD